MNDTIKKVAVRIDLVALVVQFLVLLVMIVVSYTSQRNDLANVHEMLNNHLRETSQYLRVDQWDLRNKFVDEKLSDISRKLDLILLGNTNILDRQPAKK